MRKSQLGRRLFLALAGGLLLRTAEILHVGKGATFGLGRIEIE